MHVEHVRMHRGLTRGPANVTTRAIRTAGQAVEVQGLGDTTSMGVQISDDGHNWIAATDADGLPVTLVVPVLWYRIIRERSEFMRGTLLAGNLSFAQFIFGVHKAVA